MNKLELKPGVLTGAAVAELFAYCKEAGCALPAVNVIGSNSANAAMAAARAARAPIIIQISHSGSQFFAGKTLDNSGHQASIAGSIAEPTTCARWLPSMAFRSSSTPTIAPGSSCPGWIE
jgi:fructose-bisphosphate aldolase, class II